MDNSRFDLLTRAFAGATSRRGALSALLGGLGSAVAEWLARQDGQNAPLVACGTPDAFISEAGSQQWATTLRWASRFCFDSPCWFLSITRT